MRLSACTVEEDNRQWKTHGGDAPLSEFVKHSTIQSQSRNWETELNIELRMKLMHGVNQAWSQSGMESGRHGVRHGWSQSSMESVSPGVSQGWS